MDNPIILKILVVGEIGVGKTSIIKRYCDNVYDDYSHTTLFIDLTTKISKVKNCLFKLQFMDTSGQERYRSLVCSYYQYVYLFLVVFDLTNYDSFKNIPFWLNEIKKNCNTDNIKIVLIGNCIDNASKIVINYGDIITFANNNNLDYFEVSAKTGKNINYMFDCILNNIIINRHLIDNIETANGIYNNNITLTEYNKEPYTACCY